MDFAWIKGFLRGWKYGDNNYWWLWQQPIQSTLALCYVFPLYGQQIINKVGHPQPIRMEKGIMGPWTINNSWNMEEEQSLPSVVYQIVISSRLQWTGLDQWPDNDTESPRKIRESRHMDVGGGSAGKTGHTRAEEARRCVKEEQNALRTRMKTSGNRISQ